MYPRHGRAWIGLHVPDPSTGYVWSDRSSVSELYFLIKFDSFLTVTFLYSLHLQVNFLHWQEGEPNNFNDDESCAEYRIYSLGQGGTWNDMNCESYNDWLCQIRAGTISRTFHCVHSVGVTSVESNISWQSCPLKSACSVVGRNLKRKMKTVLPIHFKISWLDADSTSSICTENLLFWGCSWSHVKGTTFFFF